MGHITIDMTISAPVATVFAYVDDYRNTTRYMKDLVKWQPTGKVTHGKGAQFDVGMKAGPTTLTSVVDITTWSENKAIGWHSNEGFRQIGMWAFRTKGEKPQPASPAPSRKRKQPSESTPRAKICRTAATDHQNIQHA